MALDIAVSVTGTATELDARGARVAAALQNQWRASQTPPLAALPTGTPAQLRTAAEAYLARMAWASFTSCIREASEEDYRNAKARWDAATDAQRAAALAQLPPAP